MRFIFKSVGGSFFRTIGRIFAYLLIGLAIAYFSGFINMGNVSAASVVDGMQVPNYMQFYNNTSNSTYTSIDTVLLDAGNIGTGYAFNNNLLTRGKGAGFSETFCGLGLLEDNYYTITLYHFDIRGYYVHPYYTTYSTLIGLGVSSGSAISDTSSSPISFNAGGDYFYAESYGGYVGSVSYVFKATSNSACFRASLSTSVNVTWEPGDFYFLGYTLTSHGSKAPTTEEIKASLDSSFNEVKNNIINSTNSINSNIDAGVNSINSNIDEMTDKVDNSLNSDNSDTSSSKCGVICKLKGIFTGIIELPGKLVTLLIDALKSLFIPSDMDFIDNLVDSLENKLGLIAEVPIQCIEFIMNLANATWTEFKSVSLPSISIFGYNFWNAQEIDISEGIKIFSTFKYVTDVICVAICVKTLFKWYEGFAGD